jgi:hypothetical protein
MKAVYKIRTTQRKPHPFQEKIERGELQLADHLNIPDRDFQALVTVLEPTEREVATRIRDNTLNKV